MKSFEPQKSEPIPQQDPNFFVKYALRNSTIIYVAADIIGIYSAKIDFENNIFRALGGACGLVAQGVGLAFGEEGQNNLKNFVSDIPLYRYIPWQWRPETNPVRYTFGFNALYGVLYGVHSWQNHMPDAAISNGFFAIASAAKAYVDESENAKQLCLTDIFQASSLRGKLGTAFKLSAQKVAKNAANIMLGTATYATIAGYNYKDPILFSQGVLWLLAAINLKFMRKEKYELRDNNAPRPSLEEERGPAPPPPN